MQVQTRRARSTPARSGSGVGALPDPSCWKCIRSLAFLIAIQLLWSALARLPCYAEPPSIEECRLPAQFVPGDGASHADALLILESGAIESTEVFIDIATTFAGDWTNITLASPAGTEVQVQSGGGGANDDFNVTYADGGALNLGFIIGYNCDGCLIQPSGPGVLGDYFDESSDGTWTLEMTTTTEGTLEEWCVRIFEQCDADAPTNLSCDAGSFSIDLTWTNNDVYDAIEVIANGLTVALLAGDAANFTHESPLPGSAYRIAGIVAGAPCRSDRCVSVFGLVEACNSNDTEIADEASSGLSFLNEVDTEIADAQIYVGITTLWVASWAEISVRSPAGTEIQMHGGAGGLASNFDVTYRDAGAANDPPSVISTGNPSFYDCGGCFVRPSGPGSFADFAGEIANGPWVLDMFTGITGTLEEWCVGVYPPEPPVAAVFRRGDADGDGSVAGITDAIFILSWTFIKGPEPPCLDAADADADNDVFAIVDALYLLEWQFTGGSEPPLPGPFACGLDPDEDQDETCLTPPPSCAGAATGF